MTRNLDFSLINTMIDPITNFGKATVSTGYSDVDNVIVLNSGDGSRFPNTSLGSYNLVWWNSSDYLDPSDDPNREIVRVTNRTGDVLTILRAQEGTAASNKNLSGKTYQMIGSLTAKSIKDLSPSPNRASFTAQVLNAPTTGSFLPSIVIPDGFAIVIRASVGNSGQVYIANSIANAISSSIPGNRNTLSAGDAAKLYLSNANVVAVAGSATGNTVDIIVEQ